MPTILILAVAAMGLVLVVLAVVVVGTRQEPSAHELTREAPSLTARSVRRMLGVHVRRPDATVIPDKQGVGLPGDDTNQPKAAADR